MFAYRNTGTGNDWAGHKSVIDEFRWPVWTIILFPDKIFGITLPTGSKLKTCNYFSFVFGFLAETKWLLKSDRFKEE